MATETTTTGPSAASVFGDLQVIDADTHYTEPHDLWTSRAPGGYEDRVPRVVEIDGDPTWTLDQHVMSRASASSVVHRDGRRCRGSEFIQWVFDDAHPAAYDVATRLSVMDELGVHAQVVYPNVAGFGGQRFAASRDPELGRLCVSIYNDAMAELQEASNGRLYPMALLPWWDVAACAVEARRAARLGLRGVNMTSDPHAQSDAPDLRGRQWDVLFEVLTELELPLHFHIGASQTSLTWFGDSPWPSYGDDEKLAIGSAMMYLTNARVLANLIYAGMLERHDTLRVVSVESGIGWIPFVLEALDHQAADTSPRTLEHLSLRPSEYFRRQIYACYWFERVDIARTIDLLGAEHILFETDFPHPTCLYPDSLEYAAQGLSSVSSDVVRKVVQDNAASLYRIPVTSSSQR